MALNLNASAKAREFQFKLKVRVTDNLNRKWYSLHQASVFKISVRASMLRIKVAVKKAAGSLKFRNVKFSALRNFVFRGKGQVKNANGNATDQFRVSRASYQNVTNKFSIIPKSSSPENGQTRFACLMDALAMVHSYFDNWKKRKASSAETSGAVAATIVALLQAIMATSMTVYQLTVAMTVCIIGFILTLLCSTISFAHIGRIYVLAQTVCVLLIPQVLKNRFCRIVTTLFLLATIILVYSSGIGAHIAWMSHIRSCYVFVSTFLENLWHWQKHIKQLECYFLEEECNFQIKER